MISDMQKERLFSEQNKRGCFQEGFVFLGSHWTDLGFLDSQRTGLDWDFLIGSLCFGSISFNFVK